MRRCVPSFLSGCVAILLVLVASRLHARGGWAEVPTVYCYDANADQDAYVATFDTVGCLDGEWNRSSNSDQWDGSTPEPGDAAPGGADVEVLPGEAEGGGDASVLSIEDVGDPTTTGFPDPSNRKVYFWRDTSSELDLARGVTLITRWRQNPEPKSLEFLNNGGTLPVPNGTDLHNGGKGQVGFVQKGGPAGTRTLAFAINDLGTLQFASDGAGPCGGGLFFPDSNCLEVDEADWVTVWMAAQEDVGGLKLQIYLNGELSPTVDTVLAAVPNGAETAPGATSYLLMALGATGQNGAIQIDYICAADGFLEPEPAVPSCPSGLNATPQGRDIALTWTNGTVAPTGVNVLRDGAQIATGAPATPPAYTDPNVDPGEHAYELVFTVPGHACESLKDSISTCPSGLTATRTPQGVVLNWTNATEHPGLDLSRDGTVIAPNLPGTSTSYTDTTVAPGPHTYSLAPTTGTCVPTEATIRVFAAPPATGDFNSEAVDWSYELDPPPDADPALYLANAVGTNILGDLDGEWSSGNGSDSWDGSAPGETGDPLLDVAGQENDPASAAPGGVGLVTDGTVGAYLIEDVGDPTTQGWLDPSNRKIYMAYDAVQSIADANTRSLVSDGFTLRTRFRLTPAARAKDVTDAPNGYTTNNGGKGIFTVAHEFDVTQVGQDQRLGFALDVSAAVPGSGMFMIGEGANQIDLPVADPTQWLDVWLTARDADEDPATAELELNVYFNGSTTPTVSVTDFVPNAGGSEYAGPGNSLYMGLNATGLSGSVEVDLVCLLDGVRAPGSVVENCQNTVDDDGDQLADCADPDCASAPNCLVPLFVRGDANGDGRINITDPIFSLAFSFQGGPPPPCRDAADATDDFGINITDPIYVLAYLFQGGPPPKPPTPSAANYLPEDCGVDSTADALDCASFSSCP